MTDKIPNILSSRKIAQLLFENIVEYQKTLIVILFSHDSLPNYIIFQNLLHWTRCGMYQISFRKSFLINKAFLKQALFKDTVSTKIKTAKKKISMVARIMQSMLKRNSIDSKMSPSSESQELYSARSRFLTCAVCGRNTKIYCRFLIRFLCGHLHSILNQKLLK